MSSELVGRYRRVYTRIWLDPKFRKLSQTEQRIFLYILTGPQSNRIGIFNFSLSTAAEHLNVRAATFRKAFSNICVTFGWMFDQEAGVVYVPTWWRWNAAVNTNILLGNLKDISELPSCALVEAFARNTQYLPESFHESFVEALWKRLSKSSPTSVALSGALSESGNQDQKPSALRAGFERKTTTNGNGAGSEPAAHLVEKARATLELVSANLPFDEQVEAYLSMHRGSSRQDAIAALNAVHAERRTAH